MNYPFSLIRLTLGFPTERVFLYNVQTNTIVLFLFNLQSSCQRVKDLVSILQVSHRCILIVFLLEKTECFLSPVCSNMAVMQLILY